MEVRPDGIWEFVMHGPDGKAYKNKSVYTEITKPERIAFEHVSTPKFQVEVNFEAQGEYALLTWKMIFERPELLEMTIKTFGAAEGLKQNVEKLEAYVADHLSLQKVPLIVEQTLNASVERVWKAITDRAEMERWYFKLEDFKAEPGFEFQFYGGPSPEKQYLHTCKVTEVIVHEKLTYSWNYEGFTGESFVTFLLIPQGDKTLLKLTHSGLETFPANNPDLARGNFDIGWNYLMRTALNQYLK
jgi:uncharacterized protein YndB with AHSA1/START domain